MIGPDKHWAWRHDGTHDLYVPPSNDTWERIRAGLQLGQRLTGTVAWVPRPGSIGIGIDLGLPVGGFVDVVLPFDTARWPAKDTISDFAIWWMDERPQIRLIAIDPGYRREDFAEWILNHDSAAADAFRRRHGA
jgi:hypothetical protein